MRISEMKKRLEMHFSPSFFGSLITRSGGWNVVLEKQFVLIHIDGNDSEKVVYTSIVFINVTPGITWANVQIQCRDSTYHLDGIANIDAERLKTLLLKQIFNALSLALKGNESAVQTLVDSMRQLLSEPRYLSNRDITDWISRFESSDTKSIKESLLVLRHPYAPKDAFSSEFQTGVKNLLDILNGNVAILNQRNHNFVENEMLAHTDFFDSVERTPLTREQRIASVVMEDRNLLVAAAGSGKTSTVVGKIGYSLLKGLVSPDEVLVLAFNNHAARELEVRIQERLGGLLGMHQIKVKTFHALGVEIIAETTGKKPSVANFTGGGEVGDGKLISELVESLQVTDSAFAAQWLLFLTICRKPTKDPAEFNSIQDWHEYVKETGDYQDGKSGYLTLNGELVKSHGEQAIANWLFMNCVAYEYERPYQYETADKKYRQYKPDFYFPEIDCYLEHYALDKKGNPPKAFGEKYRESMAWKRSLHAEKGTDVFETTFYEFITGVLFEKLEYALTKRGVKLKSRSQEELLEHLNQPKLRVEVSSLLRTFIKHAKSNELDYKTLVLRAHAMSQPYRAIIFANIASSVMMAYEGKLRSQGEVDFEDLIVDASRHVAADSFKHPYKLILVDEFQDISRARAKLLLALLDKVPDCQLFAVGDDWQSVYRFAGSDIGIFTSFQNIFGHTALNYLTKTFRSNQGIADVAANFVQKNPSQMQKLVDAQDKTTENVVVVRQYLQLQDIENLVETALSELEAEASASGKSAKVFILGRYRHQSPGKLNYWHDRFSANLNIEFRTIHASKGLQADYVILIGLHTRNSAFPSEIADDPLLQMVMPEPEEHPHAEERRLFYVALTRAKHRVYLLGGKYTPSCFLSEVGIKAEISPESMVSEVGKSELYSKASENCPKCEVGLLRKKNGKHGPFFGCSDYPSCRYTRNC